MKKLLLPIVAAALLALLPSNSSFAQQAPASRGEHGEHETTELGKHMKEINKAFRALGRQVNDPSQNESSLQLAITIHAAAEKSLPLKPEKTADLPESDQAKFVDEFHTAIKRLIADSDKLVAAFRANDNKQAAILLQQIKDDQKEGHKTFRKKRKE